MRFGNTVSNANAEGEIFRRRAPTTPGRALTGVAFSLSVARASPLRTIDNSANLIESVGIALIVFALMNAVAANQLVRRLRWGQSRRLNLATGGTIAMKHRQTRRDSESDRERKHAEMLEAALARPGVREAMMLSEPWRKASREIEGYRMALWPMEHATSSDSSHPDPQV